MGSNARDRSVRSGRKARRPAKHQPSPSSSNLPSVAPPLASSSSYPSPSPADGDQDEGHPIPNPNPNPNPSGAYEDNEWGYCTEEQLEELLLKNLDFVYQQALNRLVTLGYDEEAALRAVLCSGHCYESMDVLSNILHNAMAHLNSPAAAAAAAVGRDSSGGVSACGFTDLRHLLEYFLSRMVCLLQQIRPDLTRGAAMWCLLMSDLHVGRASTIDIPALPPSTSGDDDAGDADYALAPAGLCKFNAAAGVGGSAALLPSMTSAMRRNANASVLPSGAFSRLRAGVGSGSSSSEQARGDGSAAAVGAGDDAQEDLVDSVLKGLEVINLEEEAKSLDGAEDRKKEMILDLVRQIRDLEVQVKERKEWAQKTALQAARKLSHDRIELRTLRMEREENQHLKKGKQVLEDGTLNRLTEMENALKKASGQVDRANAAVRRLETENAEIRAEIEASKLNASESARMFLEVARREKKCLKKVLASEKQREKIQREVAEEKRKIAETEQKLAEVRVATKETEAKWKRERKLREQATAQAEEAQRAREAAEINAKRRQEALQRKIELEFQCYKDDIQRLEEELSRLQATAASTQLNIPFFNALNKGDADAMKSLKKGNGKMRTQFDKQEESSRKLNRDRVCMMCLKDDVSVLFLPCAHQVLCVNCNEDHEKGKGSCPCCNVKIDERIHVYGVSS